MGTVGSSVVVGGSHQDEDEDEKDLISQRRKSSSRSHSVDTVYCPTCQGTGRIPQGLYGLPCTCISDCLS